MFAFRRVLCSSDFGSVFASFLASMFGRFLLRCWGRFGKLLGDKIWHFLHWFLASFFGRFLVWFWGHLGQLCGGFWGSKSVILGIDLFMIVACCSKSGLRAAKRGPKAAQERPKTANEWQKVGKISNLLSFEKAFRKKYVSKKIKRKNIHQNVLYNEKCLTTPLSVHSWVRFLARFLTRIFWPDFCPGLYSESTTGMGKYSVQYYGIEKYSFTVLPGRRKNRRKAMY